MRVAPFYERYGVQFVWDLPYSGYAVLVVGRRPDLVRGFLSNMVGFAITDGPDAGMIMRSVTWDGDQAGQDGSQAPLLCWLARETHRRDPDPDWLRTVYPALAASTDWWQSPRRDVDGDGLSEFAGSTPTYVAYESGHDYSPERDLVMGEPTPPSADGLVHEPIADVFLNACLYAELEALAELAGVVDPGRVGEWEARRDALASRMRAAMWCEEVGGFFPVVRRDLCAAQPRVYRHTPALLQPLWAGLATTEEAARTIATVRRTPRGYPLWDGVMAVRLGDHLHHGAQVVTDGLHPTRGAGAAAGGVERTGSGFVLRFDRDRNPAHVAFRRLEVEVDCCGTGPVRVEIADGEGTRYVPVAAEAGAEPTTLTGLLGDDPWAVPGRRTWARGITEVVLDAPGVDVREVRLRYSDYRQLSLLSPFGLKSAHPLDGKHPAPGAPTDFWSGTIWGPHQLHACQALARHGEEDLALAVARAFCDATATSYASGGDTFEHLSHEDARGLGVGGYTWGAAVALTLMHELLDPEDGTGWHP